MPDQRPADRWGSVPDHAPFAPHTLRPRRLRPLPKPACENGNPSRVRPEPVRSGDIPGPGYHHLHRTRALCRSALAFESSGRRSPAHGGNRTTRSSHGRPGDPSAGKFSVFALDSDTLAWIESVNSAMDHMAARRIPANRNRPSIEQIRNPDIDLKGFSQQVPIPAE
ncbi:oxidoreductase C-terminal domain-containing protein [Arthrobacter sedimenti]|uniref:oxidoreductase C-terminal domain-containing protein n=1 Tax=Arthrobacter sedimenti TaxID=2694931 RepID=UPI0014227D40